MQKFVTNPPVFVVASVVTLGIVLFDVVAPSQAESLFVSVQGWILHNFGWFYLLSVAFFLIAVLILALSRFGTLKLGPDDAVPEFPFLSWVAMLFAAGMGIGLMFFAVGEPITHFVLPPEEEPRSVAASRQAMAITFFHWGFHAWAIYAVVGLSLAYFGYRYNLPLTIRSGLYPLLRERINGWWGHAVDIFAVCGTIFGIATSLGFGVLQINAGLNHVADVPVSPTIQLVLVVVVASLATASAISGIHRGIRRLSELNLLLAIGLMLFVLFVGPTAQLLRSFVQNIGLYLDDILLRTFQIYAYSPTPWVDSWTLFYWAWWISWAPYVGMFIAQISRGRTVREFIFAVLFVPAAFTFMWMTVFGNTAMYIDTTAANGALGQAVIADVSVGLFRFFEYLPMPTVASTVAIVLVAVFFITSADSGALVVDSLASGGRTNTPAVQRLYWCVLIGVVAAVLLVVGGLKGLQTATIASALPFAVVMLVLIWGLFRGMSADLASRTADTVHPATGLPWQRRLALLLHSPNAADVRRFINDDVSRAFTAVAEEFGRRGLSAEIERNAEHGTVALVVAADGARNFIYGVGPSSRRLAAFSAMDLYDGDTRQEARTFFSDGRPGYDVMGYSTEQLINDVLAQFNRYLTVLQSPRTQLFATAPDPS